MHLTQTQYKQFQTGLGLVLVALIFFMVSVQCCHRFLLATQTQAVMPCHAHMALAKQPTEKAKHTHNPCHCDQSPAQMAWDQHDSLDYSGLTPALWPFRPEPSPILEQALTNTVLSLSTDPFHTQHSPPLFLSSTYLLI